MPTMDTMRKADFDQMQIYRFRRHGLAFNLADRALKPMMVLLGDDGRYWVVRMSDGERLLRAGYEAAQR